MTLWAKRWPYWGRHVSASPQHQRVCNAMVGAGSLYSLFGRKWSFQFLLIRMAGIGRRTAFHLARMGAKVIMACRSVQKGEEACTELEQELR